MQTRFVKDLAIALIVILLGFLAVRLILTNQKVATIPEHSVYSRESVSDTLMSRIRTIESSIQDRKMFAFSSSKDPLRQGNIIKDKADRIKEQEEMIRNMFRLALTAEDNLGNKIAYIDYQDVNHEARVGDIVAGRRIIEISDTHIRYSMGGNTYTANLMPRPVVNPEANVPFLDGVSGNW
ncbi:MAG: hypothetical protein PHY41_02390 [Candidatus Cloacimonetes bacterium]|jgi:hypothetical protein|nr:hypothetical protein [Candidatus Cloacimonadota bacterium]MDY0299555.1 hypothetical protein [Candidatus Cloacimonadaceae bacterium]MCK9332848.1 hypothetical protein [Candidatus Cloacimonadota bacterium]MDD2209984.1 hypothetical protein [Candidatus Cloacimonadota bacterium]MDD3282319.1 hypothetical protein [Candidatus Cloacimonadota bacterium]